MYCHNCGKQNKDSHTFCQHCGAKLQSSEHRPSPAKHTRKGDALLIDVVNQDVSPYPYVISIPKLVILSGCTLGFYLFYWFYKQWKSFRAEQNSTLANVLYTLFSPITSYTLFKDVAKSVKEYDQNKKLEAGLLAIAYFILISLWKVSLLFGLLTFLPLIPVQNAINFYWSQKYGDKLGRSKFGMWNYVCLVIGLVFVFMAVLDANKSSKQKFLKSPSAEDTYTTNYMKNCNANGALEAYCKCTLDYLRQNYTLGERVQMDVEYSNTKELPPALTNAVKACASTLDQ